MNILQINGSRAKLCDERGDSNGIQLCFTLGEKLDLQFDLRGAPGSDGILLPYIPEWADECRSFYFAMDNSWKNQTSPLFLRTSDISLAGSVLSVKIPAATSDGLLTALAGRASAVFDVEIGGFSETLQSLFVWQFKVSVCNRIYAGGNAPESGSEPAWLTAAEIKALVAANTVNHTAGDGVKISENNEISADVDFFMMFVADETDRKLSETVYDNLIPYGGYDFSGTLGPRDHIVCYFPLNSISFDVGDPGNFGEAVIRFTMAATSTADPFAVLPAIQWVGGVPEIELGKSYIISIKDGLGVCCEVSE